MILSRPWFRFLLISAGLLSLLPVLNSSTAFAKIDQWNFEDQNQYQYDSKKIQLKDKTARLISSDPYRDHNREEFDKGTYDLNTVSSRGPVELTAHNIYETPGPEIALPVSNTEPGLAALWHFDEPSGTNVLDDASRTVAKTSDTETVSSQMGFGFSRSFDGVKSHVFIPNYETFKFERALTLELWIRPQVTVNQKPQTLVSRWQQVGSQKSFALQISPEGKLDFVVSADGALSKHQTGETVLAPGVWYHVAAVYNGEDLRVYLNGVLDSAPLIYGNGIHASSNPLYIGSLINTALDEFYKGSLDEVALYTRALSEAELLTHAGNSRGLAGLWHLNERSGPLADASGFGQHAAAIQKPDYEAEGKIGNAVHFDGKKQFVEVPPVSRFAANGALTLQAWVKPEKTPGAGQTSTILASVPDSQNPDASVRGEYSLSLSGPEGTLKATATSVNPVEIKGKTQLMPNVWQHVAVTWAEGRVRLYVNGVLDASAAYQGVVVSGKSGLRIGMDAKGLAPFSGSVDEAVIYRRARTQSEIAADAGALHSGGYYTSAIKDAGSDSEWRTFSWKELLPYGKGLSAEEVGLLHLYHLDEKDQGIFTDLKGDVQASAVGTYPVGGKFSQARWFQTKGLDKIISQKNFPSLSTFTLSFWFQFASSQPGLSDRLFSIGDANPTAFRAGDGRIHVSMPGAREIVSQTLVQDTGWHYFTLSADGRNLFLYIDGVLDGNSPFISASAEAPLILGNLKSLDTFQGAIDEVSFFNSPLSRETIFEHYLRGKMELSFQIRTSNDFSFAGVPWKSLNGNRRSDALAEAYTVGLWHLNDLRYFGRAQEVTDASRFSNHGMAYGRVTAIPAAVSDVGISLNGSSDYIRIPDADNLHTENFTLSAWIKPQQIQEGEAVILDKHYENGAPAFSSYALELVSGNRLNFRIGHSRGYTQVQTDLAGEIVAGKWNYVAATFNGKEIKLYINGALKKTASFQGAPVFDHGALYIGRYGASASRFFEGELDELNIQAKALDAEEIAAAFEALRPQSIPVTEGKLDIDRGRYFQYRAVLNTEIPAVGPQFGETEVRANLFSTDRPAVSNLKGVSYADISHFSEKLGSGNRGAVSYQLSNDGANWFYHNGRRWVIASGYTESNTADQIQTRIHDFAKEVGIGSFYFKAFLHSPTGLEPAELENVEVEYLPNKLTLSSPNGGEAWIAGSEHAISWNSSGEVQKVSLEYSRDDFKSDFHTIAKKIPNTGSYTWKVTDDLSTQVKIRVMDALEPRVYDISDLSFRIAGSLELISPNWNEQLEVGSAHEIVWNSNGKIANVKLELSTDDFVKAIYPVIDSVKNTGKYSWKVTDPISSSVKMRVSDVRDPLTFDKSNDTFSIHGNFKFLSPSAGNRWIVGSSQEIRWDNVGTIASVRVEYVTSGKDEWIPIADKVVNEKKISWKVPDEIDGKVKIRITDLNDPKIAVESPEFSIIGGLRLENPGGGENWTIGSRRKISWQTVGTIPAVNLDYKLSSQDQWFPIAKMVPNSGSYIWDIPEQPSDLVAVRVVDAADETIDTQSVTPSRIIPTFVVTAPNGGESLRIGSELGITWDTRGKVDKVKLEYSQDNFVKDVRTIISEASNIGRFSWTVPDYAGSKVKIRVSASDLPSAQDSSDGDFRIYPGFKFTSPEGGEKYEVGSLATLSWETTGTVPEVRIEYSHDDFSKDVRVAANAVPNQGRYTWTVPDDIGSGYSFRISDMRDLKAQDFSQGFFSIIGNFRILEPVPGGNYTAGVITPIKWKGAGSVPFVRIDYSEDSFEKTFQTLAEQAPNNGSYDWLVPNLIGHEFKIRVWDPSQPDAQDIMSAPAKIIGGFRLLEPNGGEVIYVGDSVDVKWEVLGTIPTVKIEYSQDNFSKNIGEIADAYENTGTYHWQVPDLPAGSYLIRISDPRDRAANDISNSVFKIRSRFTLISPNGGEGWAVGEKKTLTWQTTGSVPAVNLEYSIDNFASVKVIAQKVPNTGSYEWTIPDQVSQNVKVRVSDVNDFEAADDSDGAFRIQGVMSLVSPVGGELWKVGEQRSIEWKTAGRVEGVRIEFSHDDFSSEVKTIVESLPNSGSYNWTVPDVISANTKIRVSDLKDIRTSAVSPEPFQISASFRLMGPNGGERWHSSEKREITWATIGTVKEVNLEYSKDDFKTHETIDRGVLNTGKFTWELPRDLGDHFKVRVCDADQPAICDAGDGEFSLEAPFEFLAPKGGEVWPVGSEQELRWNLYGYVPRVFLQYSVQEPPVEWKTLIAELPNEGHLLFKTPDDISKTVRFRISDFEDADVYTMSESPVQIIGTFQLLTPNGGEKWIASSVQKITWNTLGTAPEVRLEYSTDDFKHDVKLIESSYKNTGAYDWTVPGDLAPAVKVRVKDAANEASFDISDASFKMIPHFTVLSPNGGERLLTGEKTEIQWKSEGAAPRVRLDYGTKEAGQDAYTWQPIAEVRGNLQAYSWTVPANVSSDAKIRVYDERDAETTDESDDSFKTLARLNISAPHPGEILTIGEKFAIKWETSGNVPSVKLEYAVRDLSAEAKPMEYKTIESFWANNGIYYWTVPDAAGENIEIRISDAREPDAFVVTDAFKIRGALKFDMPEGDLHWTVGSRQTLRWKTTGSISNVKLEYSVDGKNWKLIEESIVNSGTYGWLVPDDLTMTARLRVSNVQNPAVFSEFDRTITILGEFHFIVPEAAQKWTVGNKVEVRWRTTGSVKRVWLDYSANGKDWMTIAGPINNENVYEWTIPDSITPSAQLRIKDPDNPIAEMLSANFGIQGRLELTVPSAGEILEVGSSKTLEWKTTGTIPYVRIEGYWDGSVTPVPAVAAQPPVFGPQLPPAMQTPTPTPALGNDSDNWFIISAQEENRGHYNWTVPDKISDHLRIRISDTRDASVLNESAQPFSIIGTLKVISPKGGETWTVGDQQQIVWTSLGSIPEVLLEYSRDDFYREINIIASGVPNTGAALWVVPDSISDQVKARISDMRDKRAFSLSSPFFIKGKLDFITPARDEVMKVASRHILHWRTTGSIPQVRLEYSRDDFNRDVQVIENNLKNADSYEWTVPDIVSTTVKLRVMDLRDASVAALSSPFKVEGSLALKAPLGQEKLQALSSFKILWDTVGTVEKVRLEYSRDDFNQDVRVIIPELANKNSYDWIVPDDIGPGVKVRVLNASNFSVASESPEVFRIHGMLTFTVSPVNFRWPVASSQVLTWQSVGTIPQVKLEYSKDDFQKDIQLIAENANNENRYEWNVPDDISDNVRFRVSDSRDTSIFSVTAAPVATVGQLRVLQPIQDSILKVADESLVKWNTTGTLPGVRLEYQTLTAEEKQESWTLITGLQENTGEYLWKVPNAIARKARLRISDARDAQTLDISPEFSVVGKVALLAPAGGERWIAGTSHEVLWQSTGAVAEVDLQYSTDGFINDIHKIASNVPNSGRMMWTVPDAISNNVKIRIQDSRMPELVSHVSAPVSITGDFVIAAPSSPVTWKVGSEVRLEWQTVGTIPQVKLEYVTPKESGARILQDKVPNQGYYSFHAPDWIGEGGQIRLSDARDAQVAQLSQPIKIEGILEFIKPVKDEVWSVDRDQVLEWRTTGTIPSVILEYSADRFQRDVKAIQPLTENKNRFLWTVPDAAGSLSFRVRDSRDEKVFSLSEEVKVRSVLQLLYPQTQDVMIVGAAREIVWKTSGTVPQVRLEYSADGFRNDIHVIEEKAETSRLLTKDSVYSYLWTAPDFISEKIQIRISDVRDENAFSVSEPFKIKGALEVVLPQGKEQWIAGSVHEIAWKTSGTIPKIRLEYSRDGFVKDVQPIAANLDNTGRYQWTVADAVHSSVWIRVSDERDASVSAVHTNPMEVQGALKWSSPKGGENWKVGDSVKLEWQNSGTIPEITLEYLPAGADDKKVEPVMIAARVPNQGNFNWELPDTIPPHVQLRVSDSVDPLVSDTTPIPNRILGVLKVTSPDGPATWPIGSTQEIVWESRGYIPQVKVEGSRDDFRQDVQTLFPLLTNTGSVKWTVPDLISKNFRVRVSDVQNLEVSSVTSSPVEIMGGFRLLTPEPGDTLEVGAKEEISWQTVGTISEVRLEYSSDRFNHPVIIAEKIPNTGRFQWQVPDATGDHFQIRVSDVQHPEMAAISETPFSIQGRLILKSPQGGEIWKVASDVEILWEAIGTIPQVMLEYSMDEFVHAVPIVQNLSNAGRYTWRIPDIVSEKVKVRVRDTKRPNVFSASVQPLKIQGALTVLAPQGGEFWEMGTQHAILWQTTGTIPFITIEYSTDNFATAIPVILGVANTGRYQWTVPDLDSEALKFRILDAHDSSVFAVSSPLEIGGTLKILAPQGGEAWTVGDEALIKWNTAGTVSRVRIEVSTDDFRNNVQTIESSIANNGSYTWRVPDQIASSYRVRVTDANNPRITDMSKGAFKITGTLAIVAPKGGEKWAVGSSQTIEWRNLGSISALRLEYTKNNFADTVPIATNLKNTGRFTWEVPDLAGEKIQFKISDAADPSVSASTIAEVDVKPVLQLTSPKGDEVWKAQESRLIAWKTTGTMPYINLEYSVDGFNETKPIASSIANTGSFLWTVPDISARRLSLRVVNSTDPGVSSELAVPLQIQGEIKVTSPVGGEIWLVGSSHPVTWVSTGKIARVRLEYSTDGFRTSYPMVLSLPNEGHYEWTVPDAISKEGRIRVVHDEDGSVFGQNDKTFEIRGALNLLTAVGGESWVIGSRHPISWQNTGTIPQVRLEYSADNFVSDVQTIVPSLDNKGVYYWEVPAISAPGIKIRVVDPSYPDVFDVSKSEVSIQGELQLLSPAGGESYQVGERAEVLWRATPNIANVKLEYSLDNFETSKVISDYLPNNGKFVWNIPNQISTEWRIRVSDALNQTVFSFSKFPFSTHGALEMISPKGGELWPAGSKQTLSWNTLGSIPKIRIEYSSDNFSTSLPIVTSTDNSGSYLWTVPEIPYPEIRLRVTAVETPSIYSTSQGPVNIVGKLELVTPAAGERWVVGEERVIRWQTSGYMPQVDLEYSKDNFIKDVHLIASKIPNVGSFSWTVPNDPSPEMRLRVRNSENNKITAVSEAPFKVNYFQVRWMVRDSENNDHLSGLVMTDSTGKTVSQGASPSNFEYPYGIYTTVWTKVGYGEHRSTWLADGDRTFEVRLEPQKEKIEMVRARFEYDRTKDFMNIAAWYEKDAKMVPAVIQAEVKIYKNQELIKALTSTTPDAAGTFRMLWDTTTVEGNEKYFASVAVTTAAGQTLTSPISYQLDIPVKEKKDPEVRHAITSMFLRPLGLAPSSGVQREVTPNDSDQAAKRPVPQRPDSAPPQVKSIEEIEMLPKVQPLSAAKPVSVPAAPEAQLIVPETAVMNETISVTYVSGTHVRPVMDMYDANRKLVLRAQAMNSTGMPGTYSYLIPIKGLHFMPGKNVRISVIELATGKFKSAEMMVVSSPSALGYEKQAGDRTVLEILQYLDLALREIRRTDVNGRDFSEVLKTLNNTVTNLASLLSEDSLDPKIFEKFNEIADSLAGFAQRKGYDGVFVTQNPLNEKATLADVNNKMRDLKSLIQSLQRLYDYAGTAS